MNKFNLEEINDPSFIKNLNKKEMKELADEIRRFLIEHIAKTGGHLASNLGVVELTMALHKNFDSPLDRFVFDVGHQTYTHKILTGRASKFSSLRQTNGISGFAKREESPHDHYEAGHSSTSISAISGFLCQDDDRYNIAIIGDGALAGGVAFEGLNYLGSLDKKKTIVVLNDNNMAISQSVGAIHNLLVKTRGKKFMMGLKKFLYKILPLFLISFCQKLMRLFKIIIKNRNIFEDMGFWYMGPIDGNDFNSLNKILRMAKKAKRPCVVHILTKKGLGYKPAEDDPDGDYHGVSSFNIETGEIIKNQKGVSWSEIVAEIMMRMPDVDIIVPAMISGAKLTKFKEKYPHRIIDVGIAEEHAVVMASAASLVGKKIFVPIYSTFAQRAYDQFIHDVAHHNVNVVFGIDRAGIVGEDGETHQGIYDIAMFNHIPNMMVLCPSNPQEAYSLINYAYKQKNPVVIRYPRDNFDFNLDDLKLEEITEKWVYEATGDKLIVISYGRMLEKIKALGIKDITLINARFIKPLDEKMLDSFNNKKILVVEEVVYHDSLAMNIAYYYALKHFTVHMEVINLPDGFISHGQVLDIMAYYGLDQETLRKRIEELCV